MTCAVVAINRRWYQNVPFMPIWNVRPGSGKPQASAYSWSKMFRTPADTIKSSRSLYSAMKLASR